MSAGIKVKVVGLVVTWLAGCGGVVVVDERSRQGEGGAGAGAGSAGAGSADGTGGASTQDAGADDAEAGPPQWCHLADGPMTSCDGPSCALCKPGQVCTEVEAGGQWYCLHPWPS
ncbi:MAG: hypothetical protein IT372_09480 [Polyangiaceae bacterium]|nr:hypothetical protein [Polyangiaceae bacterium]